MLEKIAQHIAAKGGRAFYVGGYVRNQLMNIDPPDSEDIDIEVYGLAMEELQAILSNYGTARVVGKSFPVIKISGCQKWDFTIPINPDISFAEACGRRDFTINSMMMDVLNGEVVDIYGGREDIKAGIIKHTNNNVLETDPLRVYRAMCFAARFNFFIHPETLQLITQTDLKSINKERVYEELKKLLLLSPRPSTGLRYMQKTDLLKRMHPVLFELIGCVQSPQHHPEGDAWEHTLLVVDQAARLKARSSNPEVLMFAALLHDIGKPLTTKVRSNKITTYGHDVLGEKLACSFLQELTHNKTIINEVSILVREHMHPILLYKGRENVTNKAIIKLLNRVNLKELLLIAEADFMGRHGERNFKVIRNWFLDKVSSLGLKLDDKVEPLVKGRDLVQMGIEPGPVYTKTLDYAFELQLEGKDKEVILEEILHYKLK